MSRYCAPVPNDEAPVTWRGDALGPTGLVCVVGDRGPARTQATLAMAGRAPRSDGELTIHGHPISRHARRLPRAARRASVVTRATGLDVIDPLTTLTVAMRAIAGRPLEESRENDALEPLGLNTLDLEPVAHRPWHTLSPLEQVLGSITIASASRAEICVIDDALDGLGTSARAEATQALRSLADATLVITSAAEAPAAALAIDVDSIVHPDSGGAA